jgi:hypothetical protein
MLLRRVHVEVATRVVVVLLRLRLWWEGRFVRMEHGLR